MSFCVCRTSRTHRALLHSSAPVLWKKRRVLRDPTKPSEPIQVAPNESGQSKSSPIGNRAQHRSKETRPPFVRDALPHAEVEVAPESDAFHGRNPSFRRRSPARDEQDWSRRTGRWSASRFGGGHHQGSQMGLREDRPPSYGLNRTSRAGPADDFSRPRDSPSRRPTEGDRARPVVNRSGQGQFQSEPYRGDTERPPQLRPENSFRRPQRRPFGLQPEGDDYPSSRPSSASGWDPRDRPPSYGLNRASRAGPADDFSRPRDTPSGRPTEGDRARPVFNPRQDYPSSRPSSASGWDPWDHSQNIRKHSFTAEEDDLDTASHLDMTALSPNPRLLKNRNQPTVLTPVSPAPPASKAKSQTTQPPPKALDVSPFYNAPTALARAGVPVVAKADPATASTISSYSPAMGLKNDLPTQFTSPPLLPGLLKSLTEVIGGPKPPTRIQALSLKWVVEPWTMGQENLPTSDTEELAIAIPEPRGKDYKEFLLSSDPGSGKSIAYLLPVLQSLKLSEVRRSAEEATPIASKRGLNPRALILACTHELARQISTVAKSLLHDVKLRVLCASRANEPTRAARDQTVTGKGKKNSSASQMKALLSFADDGEMGEFQVKETDLGAGAFPVDIVVGTPMKLLEMVRGRGWERSVEFGGGVATATKTPDEDSSEADADSKERGPKLRRGRDSVPGVGKWRSSPEMGLSEVEWVIVDEADVLFDPDFQETTRMLLADISRARGHDVPFAPLPVGLLAAGPSTSAPVPTTSRQKEKEKKEKEKEAAQGKLVVKRGSSVITPLNYPFNFLLTSATIPHSLSSYLNAYHPRMLRLVTSSANHLPKTVKPEYVSWTGGNKNADIERRLRKVWAADAADGLGPVPDSLGDMSKVLIFCNKNTKVRDLGEFLNEKGIKNVQLSSSSPNRKRGNNKHLDGFLKTTAPDLNKRPDDWSSSWVADEADEGDAEITSEVVKKKEPKGSLLPVARKDPPTEKEPVNDPMHVPHVMITTSLLSRGLDFSPNVKHVFIVDDPRNMTDFLHRAGRTGRAGASGRVVIFGQMEGRGSQKSKEIRKKVKALMA